MATLQQSASMALHARFDMQAVMSETQDGYADHLLLFQNLAV